MQMFYASFRAGAVLGLVSMAQAIEVGQKPDTPKLPEVDYVVHDGTRPQPVKVAGAKAVTTPAPADATVLFDGKSMDAWNHAEWVVKDGVMVATKKGIQTKESFGDCQLHLEWKIPAGRKVHGQHGGNSGVYLMGRYEIQIQESHTNQTYPDGQAGAMYGQFPPRVNPSAPQGEWQSYDILFTAPKYKDGKVESPARVTVLHNGVVVHLNQPFYGPTLHKKLSSYPANHPAKAPINLQFHGDPIEYRNIWVRGLGAYDGK